VEHVSLRERDAGVVVLTADRPPANAMDLTLLGDVLEAIGQVASDPPRALVLAGRPGFFSAGVDLKVIPGYDPEEQRQMIASINAMALGVYELPCPVIGAITGHAIAGGLVLALCTDVRIASSAGRYGLTEVKVGVPYPQAAIGVVAAELAPHAARVLALGNELIGAAECRRLGAFDEVADPDDVVARALELAASLGAFPPEVYARTKRELRGATTARLRAAAAEDPLLARWVG
jgi:enoyl-CoA hydratase/carnithine racemase